MGDSPGSSPTPRMALVLSGGGARGAYEAGVLHYLYTRLAPRLGYLPRLDILSGTSVGAVHCCYLAAHADDPVVGVRGLVDLWREMEFSSVYRFRVGDILGFTRTLTDSLLGRATESSQRGDRIHGLLNTGPLEKLVVGRIPWRRLRRNIRRGALDTLCVSTTEIATGRTVTFVDNRERRVASWTRDPHQVAIPARIGPLHTLASAAIPFLFPAVRLGETYYCDGGLRQHTPLTPVLRLGANRVLVIGLRRHSDFVVDDRVGEERLQQFRSVGFLVGKVLNALLIDRLEYDVDHMRVLNAVLRHGIDSYGPEYLDQVTPRVRRERGLGFRVVDDVFIRPSADIGVIASEHVRRLRRRSGDSILGHLAFRLLTRGAPEDEADLMSYLLFDGEYASELIALGERDAEACEEDLARLFTPPA